MAFLRTTIHGGNNMHCNIALQMLKNLHWTRRNVIIPTCSEMALSIHEQSFKIIIWNSFVVSLGNLIKDLKNEFLYSITCELNKKKNYCLFAFMKFHSDVI